jgi:hypothetical protein
MLDDGIRPNQESVSFSSSDARSGGFLAVPVKAIRECKSCAQSLAGLLAVLRLDGGKITYRNRDQLAKSANVPVRTWTRHAAELRRLGIIQQESTPNETTETKLLANPADWFSDGFLPIPKWLLAKRLTWTERAVYAWCLYRCEISPDGSWHEDSLAEMATALGIARRSIAYAIKSLVSQGLLARDWIAGSTATTRLKPPNQPDSPSAKVARPWCKSGSAGSAKVARPTSDKNLLVRTSGQKRPDHEISVESGSVQRLADGLFSRAKYNGSDGAIFWTVSGLVAAGLVSEYEAIDAANGTAECQPVNRPAYFRAIVQRHLRRRGTDLDTLIAKIRLAPHTPSSRPILAHNSGRASVRIKSPSDC